MNYEQQITQLQGTLAVVIEIQQQQAEVQKMQAATLLVHERLQVRQAATLAVHEQLQASHAETLVDHERLMVKLREGFALHEQRMSHIDMRLAEITDKLDGMIGFMDGFTRRPQ